MKAKLAYIITILLVCVLACTACAGCTTTQPATIIEPTVVEQTAVPTQAVPTTTPTPTPTATPATNSSEIEPEEDVDVIIGDWSCIVEKDSPTTIGISIDLLVHDGGIGQLQLYMSKTEKREQVMEHSSFIWTPVGTSKSGVQTYLITTPEENLQFAVNPDGITGELKGFALNGTVQTFKFDKYLGEYWTPESENL